jgi:hypothetical protein
MARVEKAGREESLLWLGEESIGAQLTAAVRDGGRRSKRQSGSRLVARLLSWSMM